MNLSLLESMRVIALPTKTNFRGISVREVALFQGPYGWSEFSPFLDYGEEEAVPWLMCAIEAATTPRPKLYRTSVRVNGTIPAINEVVELSGLVAAFSGVTTFKVKVGKNLLEDLARLRLVKSLRPDAKFRIDANGSWSVKEALQNLDQIQESIGELEYVEQPCATLAELREVKKQLAGSTLLAGDEVIRRAIDPFAVDLSEVVDILMLKVQPLGGISRAHQIAAHHGLPVVISSALESAVGINYGAQLAASFPESNYDSGLGTGALLTADVATLPIVDGEIKIIDISPEFAGIEVAAERYKWWKNRVMRCAEFLP